MIFSFTIISFFALVFLHFYKKRINAKKCFDEAITSDDRKKVMCVIRENIDSLTIKEIELLTDRMFTLY